MSKKYTKSFVLNHYIPKLKKNYKNSKVYNSMDNELKELVNKAWEDKKIKSLNQDLDSLKLPFKIKGGRRNNTIQECIGNKDYNQASLLIQEKLIKNKKFKRPKDEFEFENQYEVVFDVLNQSNLTLEKNSNMTIDYIKKVNIIGSIEEKAVLKELLFQLKSKEIAFSNGEYKAELKDTVKLRLAQINERSFKLKDIELTNSLSLRSFIYDKPHFKSIQKLNQDTLDTLKEMEVLTYTNEDDRIIVKVQR